MRAINPAHLAFLKIICDYGSRPASWCGMGADPSIPAPVAKRLEGLGLIVKKGDRWWPTRAGKLACGRVE